MAGAPEHRAASIAVTSFRTARGDAELTRLASGLTEDVIAELSRLPDVEVLAARTSLALSGADAEPLRLAERFGVTHVVDGSLSATNRALRVKANLIEASTGRQVWSHPYDFPARDIFVVQEDIAAQVANHVRGHLTLTRLARAKSRPVTSLEAYDLWLRGRDGLRRGTLAADAEARELFERALTIDPTYARGYVGLSLSHFNEWSCQLWSKWQESERLAFEYAKRAVELDETDHVAHSVVGRILVYRRELAQARRHLERALSLSPNDADMLVQLSLWTAYVGDAAEAVRMSEKAFRLNPLHDDSYYVYGGIPHVLARQLEPGLALLERAPPNLIVDQSAYIAASHAHLGNQLAARRHVEQFLGTFRDKITAGREPEPGEPLAYLLHVNPFARAEDAEFLVEGLRKAGLGDPPRSGGPYLPTRSTAQGSFRADPAGGHWALEFAGTSARVKDLKGCRDLATLLGAPGERFHVMELAGRVREGDLGPALDASARAACQRKMRELAMALDEAEADADLGRAAAVRSELEALTEQLTQALGLGGRSRKLGDPVEKARTAVTWRIRDAIRRIAEVHPALGRHLDVSVRTGVFCVYSPESPTDWSVLTM